MGPGKAPTDREAHVDSVLEAMPHIEFSLTPDEKDSMAESSEYAEG